MKLYAIGDPHLSLAVNKPMTIFGDRWAGHPVSFFQRWEATVAPEDIVLVPGDISWGMTTEEALPDLQALDELPGRKLMIPGNHDYWWESLRKLRELPLQTIEFIQNDAVLLPAGAVPGSEEPVAVCGTRGWLCPGDRNWNQDLAHNEKIYAREVARLKLSLEAGRKLGATQFLVMLHYPPVADDKEPTGFTELLESFGGVLQVVYGHIHSASGASRALQGEQNGVLYRLVACDQIDFTPHLLFPVP